MDPSAPGPALPTSLGKYQVLGLLGQGSMGTVFLAHDSMLERKVAIKVMSGSAVGDGKLRERFEREAKAIAKLQHPNIVTVHDLGYDENGSPFIAMELLEGSDLHDLIEGRPLRLQEKLDIVMQVCRGLTHAHGNGIVHRDIKPANIFVGRDRTAKITDFGVARWLHTTRTQAGLVVGTAGYISPEQLRGKPVDERTDIFSLGVVLFEILTNEILFSGDTIETVFFKTLGRETPVVLGPGGQELPALQGILRRALAKDVSARYRSADELREALQSFADTHRGLLGEIVPFETRQRSSPGSESRTTSPSKAPTRVLSSPASRMPAVDDDRKRPRDGARSGSPSRSLSRPRSRPRPRPPARSSYGRLATAAGLVLLAGVLGLYSWFRERPVTSSSTLPAPTVTAVEPDPGPRDETASLVADAALALSRGNLEEAKKIVERGQKEDPDNERWGELREQIEVRAAEAEKRSLASRYLDEGRQALERNDLSAAIGAFTRAVESDPANAEARKGLDRAVSLAKKPTAPARVDPPPRPSPQRKYVESRTQFMPVAPPEDQLMGFEAEPGIEVGETEDAYFPAQILLELSPPDAKPGQTYTIGVSLFNEGYRPVEVRSLELVSRFEGKTSGKGQLIPPLVTEIGPRATVRIYEVSATWKEALSRGEIEATVTLADGGKLRKSVRW